MPGFSESVARLLRLDRRRPSHPRTDSALNTVPNEVVNEAASAKMRGSRRSQFPRDRIKDDLEIPMSMRSKTWPPPDTQLASPLYSVLPAEIRLTIFEYALSEATFPHQSCRDHDFSITRGRDGPNGSSTSRAPSKAQNGEGSGADGENRNDERRARNNSRNVFHHETWYLRPGYEGRKDMSIELLRTCRRTFLEAHHLVLASREQAFWFTNKFGLAPDKGAESPQVQFARVMPIDAAVAVRAVHIFSTLALLEMRFFRFVWYSVCRRVQNRSQAATADALARDDISRLPRPTSEAIVAMETRPIRVLDRLETLHITVRWCDWWPTSHVHWEPFSESSKSRRRRPDTADQNDPEEKDEEDDGTSFAWPEWNSFASTLLFMPRLRKLVIELEVYEQERHLLDRLVARAQTWRFPVSNEMPESVGPKAWQHPTASSLRAGRHSLLSFNPDIEPVRWMSWTGLPDHYISGSCEPTCGLCKEIKQQRDLGERPTFVMAALTFTAKPQTPVPEAEAASGKTKYTPYQGHQNKKGEMKALEYAVGRTISPIYRTPLSGYVTSDQGLLDRYNNKPWVYF